VAWLPGACNTPFLRMNKCVVPGLGRVRLASEGKGHTFESCRAHHRPRFRKLRRRFAAASLSPIRAHGFRIPLFQS